jgi:hypothetical protein|tara:strand:+ start:133 stop:402 length:270 start_codon:yes stop_codon:yes gene_type:complete
MTRRIPILAYNDELSSKKHQVYKSLIDGVSEAIKTNKKEIKLCEVKNSNLYITVEKPKWKKSLDSALQYYIDKEEYEQCSKIKNLIDKL